MSTVEPGKCPYCGGDVGEIDENCLYCGSSLKAKSNPAILHTGAAPQPGQYPQEPVPARAPAPAAAAPVPAQGVVRQWFLFHMGQRIGPVAESFVMLVAKGRENEDIIVWCEGMPEWRPIQNVFPRTAHVPQSAQWQPPAGGPLSGLPLAQRPNPPLAAGGADGHARKVMLNFPIPPGMAEAVTEDAAGLLKKAVGENEKILASLNGAPGEYLVITDEKVILLKRSQSSRESMYEHGTKSKNKQDTFIKSFAHSTVKAVEIHFGSKSGLLKFNVHGAQGAFQDENSMQFLSPKNDKFQSAADIMKSIIYQMKR